MSERLCRFCGADLVRSFCDLGMSPLSNAFVKRSDIQAGERYYPLHAYVCDSCLLVQLEEFEHPGHIFGEYAYFSSYADSWLAQARVYQARMSQDLALSGASLVIEVASNDGYLLQYFKEAGIPVLGIEPARNVAAIATKKGIPTLVEFLGAKLAARLASERRQADLVIANNVLAHVPDLHDFTAGLRRLLKPQGVLTVEFPHLLKLVAECQFDTIYHEHFSYFSLATASRILDKYGLRIFDVEELPSHGGSLRAYATTEPGRRQSASVGRVIAAERAAGLDRPETYSCFAERVQVVKRRLLEFLIDAKERQKSVVGYGAPAKATTLLNYCGIGTDFIEFTVDRSPYKQNLLMPGCHIPIFAPERILERHPDYVLILPWNLKEEIVEQMKAVLSWGGKFVVPIPSVAIL